MTKKPLRVIAGTPDQPLKIGDIEIPCYVLEDETRVLSLRGIYSGIGMSIGGGSQSGVPKIGEFLAILDRKGIDTKELTACFVQPLKFQPPGGGRTAYGSPATILVDLCTVILTARDAGILQKSQLNIAHRADTLIRGLATVGVIALVDEATGYQRLREERALATILERFLAKELQPWTRTFPYAFYREIFRLRRWPGPDGIKRPQVIGHFTNDIVYKRIAPGVLEELKQKNPVMPTGRRKATHHEWFTPALGHPKLKEHLAAVTALMRAAPNWNAFMRSLNRAFPAINTTAEFPFDDEVS